MSAPDISLYGPYAGGYSFDPNLYTTDTGPTPPADIAATPPFIDSGGGTSGSSWLSGLGSIISAAGSAFSNAWTAANPVTPLYPGVAYVNSGGQLVGVNPLTGLPYSSGVLGIGGGNSTTLLLIAAVAAYFLLRK